MREILALAIVGTLAGGCTGPTGAQGPAGPLSQPPHIDSLSPGWGSAATQVTITGTSFSTTAANDRVTFDGAQATVISATATSIVAQPSLDATAPRTVAVAVEVAQQVSNPVSFELVPPGTARPLGEAFMPQPTGVTQLGSDLYVAAGPLTSPGAGLYHVEADGRTSRVWTPRLIEMTGSSGTSRLYDAPVAVTNDGTDVLFTTAWGSVRRYHPADGSVDDVLTLMPGGPLPALTGIAITTGGAIYVVDRSVPGVQRISADGQQLATITLGSDPYGITADGTDVYVSDDSADTVFHITGTAVDGSWSATLSEGMRGIAVLAGTTNQIVVSGSDGVLYAAPLSGSGPVPMAALLAASTPEPQPADGMILGASGDLILAQPLEGSVRSVAPADGTATILAVGPRVAAGTLKIGDSWFFASDGPSLFSSLPSGSAEVNSAVVRLDPDGSMRVLTQGMLFFGMTQMAAQLVVSDCLAQKITQVDPDTGATSDLLTAADGLNCPSGLYASSAGDLYYLDTDLSGTNPATLGRRSADGTLSPAFATGLPGSSLFITPAGQNLLVGSLSPTVPEPIYSVDATNGGAATVLVPGPAAGPLMAMDTAPDGTVYIAHIGLGDIATLDPVSGAISPWSSAFTGVANVTAGGGPLSMFLSMGFLPDDTMLVADYVRADLIAIAP